MTLRPTYSAGHPAPKSGIYEQINVFGSPTGVRVHVTDGHPMPETPIGHDWVVVEDANDDR